MSYSFLVILNIILHHFQYELVFDHTAFDDTGIRNSKVILIACSEEYNKCGLNVEKV